MKVATQKTPVPENSRKAASRIPWRRCVATLVWGFGLVALCASSCGLVFMVSIKQYLLLGGPISYGMLGLLTIWTYVYLPRAIRVAQASQASAG